MATWKEAEIAGHPGFTWGFTYSDAAWTSWSKVNTTIDLLYDADSATPTSVNVKIRVRSNCKTTDGLYLLYDPGNTNRLFQIKPYNGTTASTYYSGTFSLTKSATASTFNIKAVWACNTGAGTVNTSTKTVTYETGTYTFYDVFSASGLRANYAKRQGSSYYLSIEPEKTIAEKGTEPTLYLADRKNNYFNISGAFASGGENNALKEVRIYYTTDGSNPKSASSSRYSLQPLSPKPGASYSYSRSVSYSCTIKAYITCKLDAMTLDSDVKSISVTYYSTPTKPGRPVLSYSKNRLTVKEPWTFTWTASPSSTVKGYYIWLMRCPKGSNTFEYVENLGSSTSNDYIEIDTANTELHTKRANKSCTVVLNDPAKFGFEPGDRVLLRIAAYRNNGAGGEILSDSVDSLDYTVMNAGIVHVKVANEWKEGQVWVKANNEWHEAQTVNVNSGGEWKESQ